MLQGEVVVVGSSNYDRTAYVETFPEPGQTVLTHEVREAVGGKGANQAVAAATLGADVVLLTALGDDAEGRAVQECLVAAGIELCALSPATGRRTGSAFITVDERGENTILVSPGANADHTIYDTHAALSAALTRVTTKDAALVAQAEIPVETITAAARYARRNEMRFILNLAPFVDVGPETLAAADPLVLNQGEAQALLRSVGPEREPVGPMEPEALLERLAPCATSLVVTLGADGAAFLVDGRIARTPTPRPMHVVDTTGAGDAFVGALAALLSGGSDLATSVVAATRLSTLTVRRHGASSSYAAWTAEEIEQALHDR